MAVTAYAPIGAPGYPNKKDSTKTLNLFEEPVIVELSEKYKKTAA
jgi:diketogulonate reductase-like aldo/keto reductase